jgi:hypothetical protein
MPVTTLYQLLDISAIQFVNLPSFAGGHLIIQRDKMELHCCDYIRPNQASPSPRTMAAKGNQSFKARSVHPGRGSGLVGNRNRNSFKGLWSSESVVPQKLSESSESIL